MLATIYRFVQYIAAVRKELDILDSVYNLETIGEEPNAALPIGMALSVALGVLVATAPDILVYSSFGVIFAASDLLGPITITTSVASKLVALSKSGHPLSVRESTLFEYFLLRPLLIRSSILFAMAVGALVLALMGRILSDQRYNYGAYVVWIASILASEIAIRRWRQHRDDALRAADRAGSPTPVMVVQ